MSFGVESAFTTTVACMFEHACVDAETSVSNHCKCSRCALLMQMPRQP